MNLISLFSECPNFRLGSSYLQRLREATCECRECRGEVRIVPVETASTVEIIPLVRLSLWQRFLAWVKGLFR